MHKMKRLIKNCTCPFGRWEDDSSGSKVVLSIEVNELSYLTSSNYRNITLYVFIKIIACLNKTLCTGIDYGVDNYDDDHITSYTFKYSRLSGLKNGFDSYSSCKASDLKIHLPCSKTYLPCIFVG